MTITSFASDSNHYDPQISEYTSDGGLTQCTELQTELRSKDGGDTIAFRCSTYKLNSIYS